ncbi:probably inactive leucine-rich repeat receptor-like protein kinase At5g48380 [Mangifera indica]|uniref:probably inactive leucine-rich repeat receptor-like protein kinase At5g48380 n=1 Tax=Mangifera indica TaxID=29780 RepID=UPI001CFA597E|nr:probably inactive leucine-rich repeat receptor-like protein kinase At5g48380 [Mangifera indica]
MEFKSYSFNGFSLWILLSCSLSYATEQDIACLKSIKASLEDPYNYLSASWNFNNNTEGYICKFAGVECWNSEENRVLNLRLSDMGLKGEFPRGISNCSSMTGLDLSSNNLSGSLPENISHLARFLTSLDLSSNNFSGNIPANLANCSYLNTLKLDHNQFTGQIPAQLGQLDRLKTFSVANNQLSGEIPHFSGYSVKPEDFAGNLGLCGYPLKSCQKAK